MRANLKKQLCKKRKKKTRRADTIYRKKVRELPLLQSHSNKANKVLMTEETTRSVEQNSEPRNRPKYSHKYSQLAFFFLFGWLF
jgi:hypothetical protein